MAKKRILFVDDEPHILAGLRRMLHDRRHEWDVLFATSGAEALTLMGEVAVDAIITDMRMPGMDGAELLNRVRQHHPHTVRYILSGHSDRDVLFRSITATHQILAKPCDPRTLVSAITRALALRDLLASEHLRRVVSQAGALPSLPRLYAEVVTELEAPDPSIQRIARIIERDMAMSAKVLQFVNSAFFGLPVRVSNIQQAASLLGLDCLRSLTLTAGMYSLFDRASSRGCSLEDQWDHALTVGLYARAILNSIVGPRDAGGEDVFVAGILHDVGRLLLMANLPSAYHDVMSLAQQSAVPIATVETQLIGATHAEIGAYLLGLWGLSDPTVEAVAYHHRPSSCASRTVGSLLAVHMGNVLAHEFTQPGVPGCEADPAYLQELGLEGSCAEWRDLCRKSTRWESAR